MIKIEASRFFLNVPIVPWADDRCLNLVIIHHEAENKISIPKEAPI